MTKSSPSRKQDLHIEIILARDLLDFATSVSEDDDFGVMPIDRSRAQKWVKNPNVRDDSPLLMLSRDAKGKCTGYLGLMPGKVTLHGEVHDIAWTTTGYLKLTPKTRGTSDAVCKMATELYSTIVATGNSRAAERFFRRVGWQEVVSSDTFRVGARRLRLVGMITPFTAPFVPLVPSLQSYPLPESQAFLQNDFSKKYDCYFPASRDVIEWMLSEPWFPRNPKPTRQEEGYLFGGTWDSIVYKIYEYPGAGMILSIAKSPEETRIKVLDYFASNNRAKSRLLRTAIHVGMDVRANELFVPKELLEAGGMLGAMSKIFIPNPQTYFFASHDPIIKECIKDLRYSTVDGDTRFW